MPSINKVVYGNRTIIDLTGDTVAADKLLTGYTAHDASGATINGTYRIEPNKAVTLTGSGVVTPSTVYVDGNDIVQMNTTGTQSYSYTLRSYNRTSPRAMSKSGNDYYYPQTQTTSESITLTSGTTYRIHGTFTAYNLDGNTGDNFHSIVGKITVDEVFTWDGTSYDLTTPIIVQGSDTYVSKVAIESSKIYVYWSEYDSDRYTHGLMACDYSASGTMWTDPITITEVTQTTYNAMAQVTVNIEGGGGGSVSITDVANATGTTCVITTGSSPTPSETWETVYSGEQNNISDTPYNYFWISSLTDVTIPVGSVWRITADYVPYRLTAYAMNNVIYLGNPKYSGGTDDESGVPFNFSNQGWGAWVGDNDMTGDTTHTFLIERLVTE